MKNYKIIGISLLLLVGSFFGGCDAIKNTNNTQKGAAIGTTGGAVLGGILGNNMGSGGRGAMGAVLGGVLGGVAGGVIGNKMDKQAREIDQALPGAKVERVGEGILLVLNENAIRFDYDKSSLTPEAKENLDKLFPVLQGNADTNIQIFGYTDNTGSAAYNVTLSEKRAQSVKAYLVSKGLKSKRFKTYGYGIEDPIASNETADGRSQNRRVEFAITANDQMIQDAKSGN
jgi:outer membrane protein OmpA-like peptidoglycan-associated protein